MHQHQHQHAPLPLEGLKDVPQPVVVLLEKDPVQRFRTPNELLKAIPRITGAIDTRHKITRQSLQKTPSTASRIGTRKPPARLGPKKISLARLPVTGSEILAERRISLFWIVRGQRRKSTSLPSLHGLGSGSPRSSTIGSEGWLRNVIVLRNLFLAGPFTDRARLGTLPPQKNCLMPL